MSRLSLGIRLITANQVIRLRRLAVRPFGPEQLFRERNHFTQVNAFRLSGSDSRSTITGLPKRLVITDRTCLLGSDAIRCYNGPSGGPAKRCKNAALSAMGGDCLASIRVQGLAVRVSMISDGVSSVDAWSAAFRVRRLGTDGWEVSSVAKWT